MKKQTITKNFFSMLGIKSLEDIKNIPQEGGNLNATVVYECIIHASKILRKENFSTTRDCHTLRELLKIINKYPINEKTTPIHFLDMQIFWETVFNAKDMLKERDIETEFEIWKCIRSKEKNVYFIHENWKSRLKEFANSPYCYA